MPTKLHKVTRKELKELYKGRQGLESLKHKEFSSLDFTGIDFEVDLSLDYYICKATYKDCKFENSSFKNFVLNDTAFIDCDLTNAHFGQDGIADSKIKFINCNLRFTSILYSKMKAEFKNCRIEFCGRTNFNKSKFFNVVMEG